MKDRRERRDRKLGLESMKVVFLTNLPSPYRVDFFNELGKNVDLTVCFEDCGESNRERDKRWYGTDYDNFHAVFLKKITFAGRSICKDVLKYLDSEAKIVVCNYHTPTGMLAILYMKSKGIPFYLEADGAFPKEGTGIREQVKRFLISSASGWFSTAEVCDQYYLTYGAKKERIVRYPFSSIRKEQLDSLMQASGGDDVRQQSQQKSMELQQQICQQSQQKFQQSQQQNCQQSRHWTRQQFRQQLGMTEQQVVLCVGQFIHRKGIDLLLRVAKYLPERIGVYIIGGTDSTKRQKEVYETHFPQKNIHFLDFCVEEELARYYQAADLFVLPTREDIWGLVINEAMAYGLPVITTNRCIAGLELVEDGKDGYIIPTEDAKALYGKMKYLLKYPDEMHRMGQHAQEKMTGYTIETMAQAHVEEFLGSDFKMAVEAVVDMEEIREQLKGLLGEDE